MTTDQEAAPRGRDRAITYDARATANGRLAAYLTEIALQDGLSPVMAGWLVDRLLHAGLVFHPDDPRYPPVAGEPPIAGDEQDNLSATRDAAADVDGDPFAFVAIDRAAQPPFGIRRLEIVIQTAARFYRGFAEAPREFDPHLADVATAGHMHSLMLHWDRWDRERSAQRERATEDQFFADIAAQGAREITPRETPERS